LWVNYAYALPVTRFKWQIVVGKLCSSIAAVTQLSQKVLVGQMGSSVASHKRKLPNHHGLTVHMHCKSQKKTAKSSWLDCAYALPVT
jgi:hypothetical protein